MNILSIKPDGHDTAASILTDDGRIFSAEEERFNRIKHSGGKFPSNAISYCLKNAGLKIQEIDFVGIASEPKVFRSRDMLVFTKNSLPHMWKPYYTAGFFYRTFSSMGIPKMTERLVKKHFGYCPPIRCVEHHLAHASSAFRMSGFNRANIITLDGEAELISAMLAVGNGTEIEVIKRIHLPHSLGHLYSTITEKLGFEPNEGEGKVMGLAAYGKPALDFSNILKVNGGGFTVDYKKLEGFPRRLKGEELTKEHKNVAASLQKAVTEAFIELARYMRELTGYRNLCLAGGVVLNADANGKLLRSGLVDDIFIQPAASDPGTTLGACLHIAKKNAKMEHNYLGPRWANEKIEKILKQFKVRYRTVSGIEQYVGEELLPKGKIVGWFQGRMELGPRALGNRSILADPRNSKMKDELNNRVKHREPWRPFAPSVLEEKADKYFIKNHHSPYMILMFDTYPEKSGEIPAAIHVDGTARTQTVSRKTNPKYHGLIRAFYRETGVPVIVNTSFNLAGEPIVCSPQDAIRTFYGSGMDYLAIGNYLLSKN